MAPFVRIRVVTWASVLAVGLCAIAGARGTAMAANDTPPAIDESAARAAIADLLERIPEMNIASMPALSVQRFTLPSAGVDVMRARVQESYTIEGIGTETVELNGWIAVLHRDPVTIREGEVARWGNVVIGTEFVALDLRGESDLFGPIQVRLNPAMPSLGEVGWWEKGTLPYPLVELAALDAEDLEDLGRPPGDCAPLPPGEDGQQEVGVCCYAPLSVIVDMPQLGLTMTTGKPVLMYSYVETIPPVGYTASISLTPTDLIYSGRKIGTLLSASVKFREIVYHLPLPGLLPDRRFDLPIAQVE